MADRVIYVCRECGEDREVDGRPLGIADKRGALYREHVHAKGIIAPVGTPVTIVTEARVVESAPGVVGYVVDRRSWYDTTKTIVNIKHKG